MHPRGFRKEAPFVWGAGIAALKAVFVGTRPTE